MSLTTFSGHGRTHAANAVSLTSSTTARQPSRALAYLGFQTLSERSFRFEMRSERVNISPSEPARSATHFGGIAGGFTPSAEASESKNSRLLSGSSSATL